MTLQEKDLLLRFLQQLANAQALQKDPEAEMLIRDAVGRQPDAAYLLVQRAIQLDQALQATQAQVQKLQAEAEQLRPGSRAGFLNDNTWGSHAAPVAQNAPPARATANSPAAAAPASAWGGGMLGNIATTAAGVVAGSFLFQGIERMMHHGDTSWGSGREHAASSDANQNVLADNEYTDHDTPPVDDDIDSFADSGDSSDFA